MNNKSDVIELKVGPVKKDEIPLEVKYALAKAKIREQSLSRKERRYRDSREYLDGLTESCVRELANTNPVEDEAEQHEMSQKVRKAISMLDETQQRRIYLFYFAGLNKSEIGRLEGVSHQNVAKSIKRALKKLKKFLE